MTKQGDQAMAAFVIADITVTDPEKYKNYTSQTPATVEKFGGKFVVRGGDVTIMSGEWKPNRLVVIEFPNMATLKKWYKSKDYQKIAKIREEASEGSFVFVDGV
ncbi:MAG: D-fructose-6-phosphate amidotransferase [Rhodospirillaceae bacterium]|nr:D-fructose-6-phosphate amidotransferase [Rhodospirillaceae bacterium]